jgi:hypothetical protein
MEEIEINKLDIVAETLNGGEVELEAVEIEIYALEGKHVPPHAKRFVIRIDDDKYETENPEPTGDELLALRGQCSCSHELEQLFRHKDAQRIGATQTVNLLEHGVERFVTVTREVVTIFVDTSPIEIPRGNTPIAEIKRLGGILDGYQLALDDDGVLRPLANDGRFEIRGCENFESRPPAGGAS